MLRCQPIVDGDDNGIGLRGERCKIIMEGLAGRGSDAEATTVVVNDEWKLMMWTADLWEEEAGGYARLG